MQEPTSMQEPSVSPDDARDGLRLAVAPLRCHGVVAEPRALRALRHELMAWALGSGLDADRAQDLSLASYEALANVVDHAYRGAEGVVDVDATLLADRIEVVIADQGRWRSPVPDHSPVSLRGRGLLLLNAGADKADIVSGPEGTIVTLTWEL